MPHSVRTLAEHTRAVYNAVWNTQDNSLVASCSGDGTVKIWDLNCERSVTTVTGPQSTEVLALDWNKYNQFELVAGSANGSIVVYVRETQRVSFYRIHSHVGLWLVCCCRTFDSQLVKCVCSQDITTR